MSVKAKKHQPHENKQDFVAKASLRDVRISPRRARLMLNLIKGKQVEPALQILEFSPKKSAVLLKGLLKSAIANASEHKGADVDRLWVSGGWVDGGPVMKRYKPAGRGRATPIRKRSAHITILLNEQ